MKLQNILFPKIETVSDELLFFRRDEKETEYVLNENKLTFEKKAVVSFDTYYNSFSAEKWNKYTVLDNLNLVLELKGEFNVYLKNAAYFNGRVLEKDLFSKKIIAPEKTTIKINISNIDVKGCFYFKLEAREDNAVFYGGFYDTEVSNDNLNPVSLAIGICTYKREKFVQHNLNILSDQFINNCASELHGKLEVYVSDNGQTLDQEHLAGENIHIFSNKNLGGAGGFGRAMYEIYQDKEKKQYTHVLLMDDDVVIQPESVLRTYNFLKLVKTEYKNAFLGGAMLRLDDRFLQSEAADYWSMYGSKPVKYKYDLRKFDFVLKNEIEDTSNYLSWWYCVMPIAVVNKNNFPLPIFIKRDDIEYGLRNGKTFITLNGINVWHEPFENKRTGFLEYYYWRNQCILNAIHYPNYGAKEIRKQLLKKCISYTIQYRYKDALLCLKGVEDFLKGIDYLKNVDAEQLHKTIMNETYKMEKVENIDFFFVHGAYTNNRKPKKENKIYKIVRKITLNGYLLPAKKTIVVPVVNAASNRFFRVKNVIHYEEATGTAFKTTRDIREVFKVGIAYLKLCRLIEKKYEKVKFEYNQRYRELTDISFWENYLFSDSNYEPKTSANDNNKQQIKCWGTKKTIQAIIAYPFLRLGLNIQNLIARIVPVKKNKIAIYVHKRRGYTCNPKYIVEKILETDSNKYELFWITQHPESCEELKLKGLKVVKAFTLKHFITHFTSKVLISNDNLYGFYTKRANQLYINTWHGAINYKKIGYESMSFPQKIQEVYFRMHNRQPDVYLSGSEFFTKNTADSFGFDEKIFVPTGLPRNDLLFEQNETLKQIIKEKIGIKNDLKIVLYAPTFRSDFTADDYGLNFENLINTLSIKFGGEWVVLYRTHYFVNKNLKFMNENVIDVSQYDDMQELLYVSDVLISDYSSCMWDFSLTNKPCFVFATDIEKYVKNDRAFAYPIEKWPYSISKNNLELEQNILNFNMENYEEKINAHQYDANKYDVGNASQKVVEIIDGYCAM